MTAAELLLLRPYCFQLKGMSIGSHNLKENQTQAHIWYQVQKKMSANRLWLELAHYLRSPPIG